MGEAGAIVTDIDSGHGVVEEIKHVVVVSVAKVFREDMVGEVLVVSDEKRVVKAVTEDPVFSIPERGEDVERESVVVTSIEFTLAEDGEEDIIVVDIEEEIIVPKEVLSAFVDVLRVGKESVGETQEVLCDIVGVGVVTNIVVTVMAVSGVEGVGEVAVIEVAEIEVFVGVVTSVVAIVTIGWNHV